MIKLEICVDDVDGLKVCEQAGVDRIELCSALSVGGLTPSYGLMAKAAELSIPIAVMIRPTDGGFQLSDRVLALMLEDVAAARHFGLEAIVVGALDNDFNLDMAAMAKISEAANGLDIVLHRAIDVSSDPQRLIDQAIDLGVKRILTSGGQLRAIDGIDMIRQMVEWADGHIEIMAGSGITPDNVLNMIKQTHIQDVHASCAISVPQDPQIARFGFGATEQRKTDLTTILAMKREIYRLTEA